MNPINLRERAKIILFSAKILFFVTYIPLIVSGFTVAWLLFACSLITTALIGLMFSGEKTEKVSFLFKCNDKQLAYIEELKSNTKIKNFVDNCITENGYLDGFNFKIAKSMQHN